MLGYMWLNKIGVRIEMKISGISSYSVVFRELIDDSLKFSEK